jgi:hypothetical protein
MCTQAQNTHRVLHQSRIYFLNSLQYNFWYSCCERLPESFVSIGLCKHVAYRNSSETASQFQYMYLTQKNIFPGSERKHVNINGVPSSLILWKYIYVCIKGTFTVQYNAHYFSNMVSVARTKTITLLEHLFIIFTECILLCITNIYG